MAEEKDFLFWRRLLIIFNIFYGFLALIFLSFAIYSRLNTSITDLHLFVGLLVLSIYLTFISLFGIAAVLKHHQVLLFFYIILLFVLFLVQFILACTYLSIHAEKKYELLKDNYNRARNVIQMKYNCCGFDNRTQWNRTELCAQMSCCLTSECCLTLPMCYPVMQHTLEKYFKLIGSIMLIFTLAQIIAIYITLRFRNMRNPSIFV
jgi:tetraspanin-13/31